MARFTQLQVQSYSDELHLVWEVSQIHLVRMLKGMRCATHDCSKTSLPPRPALAQVQRTFLDDLDDNCITHILRKLSPLDVFSVAGTCRVRAFPSAPGNAFQRLAMLLYNSSRTAA